MVYVFGDYTLNTRTCELQRAGQPVPLTPKVYQVLVYLLEHRQRFVPTDELLQQVWPDAYVDDSAVKRCIAMARRALGDGAAASRWIQTVRGRGYRFVAAVHSSEPVPDGVRKCTACAQEVVLPAVFCAACGQPLPVVPPVLVTPLPVSSSPARPYRQRHSPFVGRQTEIAMLHARLLQVERGQGQVIGILGEPGMGKSRLLYEVQQWLGNRQMTYWHGACQPYGQAVPYLLLRDLLANAWHLTPTDSPAVITARVRTGLQAAGVDWEHWGPCLVHLLGGEVSGDPLHDWSPEQLKAHTFAALHQVLVSPRQQRPGVLAIEDAHWIDATSEAYLAALVERLARTPHLLLVTFRPGYHPSWLDKSYATQLALPPLAVEDSRQVVHAVLGATPPDIEQQLLSKAAGNPFFLEELAYTVAEQSPTGVSLSVPDTIQAVIAGRLDRLSPLDKRVLHVAAVVDAEIPLSLLHRLTGLPAHSVEGSLRRLQASEFLYETRLLPELAYTFKHALTQEVAYSQVLPEQRRRLHRQIVAALETLAAEQMPEQLDLLARHALRGELWAVACRYFRQAGQRALARSAYREAVLCFEQALSSVQHLSASRDTQAQTIDLHLNLRNALLPLGENSRCLSILREAEACAQDLDDARRLGWIACYTSAHAFVQGHYAPAVTAGQRALALALACEDSDLQTTAYLRLGQAYHAMGEYDQAKSMLGSTIPALEEHPPSYGGAELAGLPTLHARVWLVLCLAELGAFAEGRARGAEAIHLATAVARPYSLLMTCTSLGLLDLRQGDVPRAVARLERALQLCQEVDTALVFPAVATHLGMAYTLAGRLSAALPLLEQAVTQATARHLLMSQPQAVLALAEAAWHADRLPDAEHLAMQALELCQQHGAQGVQAWTLYLLGEMTAQRQPVRLESAVQWYQQALALAQRLLMQPLVAHCHFGLGRLSLQTGQAEAARAALSTAATLFDTMAMLYWLEPTTAALASLRP